MSPITSVVTAVATAIAKIFGYADNRQALKNTATMAAAKGRENEVTAIDQVNQAIAKKDVAAIQKELSE